MEFKVLINLFIVILLSSNNCQKLKNDSRSCIFHFDKDLNREVYDKADIMPSYEGGELAFLKGFYKNFHYPDQEIYQGKVILLFVIGENGIVIKKGIRGKTSSQYTSVEKEALRVLQILPKWIPGKCDDKIIPVQIYRPILFNKN